MRLARVEAALIAIGLGLAGASVAAAVPASAATTPAITTVHVTQKPSVPKVPDPSIKYVTFVYSSSVEVAECFAGNEDSMLPSEYVSNGCTTRVWLYKHTDETGYNLCLQPNSTTGHLFRKYHSFRIVSNSKSC